MLSKLMSVVVLVALPAVATGSDGPFVELPNLPEATVAAFPYEISLGVGKPGARVMVGRVKAAFIRRTALGLRGVSPERIPGDAAMKLVVCRTTAGNGIIDIAATEEIQMVGKPVYPPDKSAASFSCGIRRLMLIDNEAMVRLRFKDQTHHYRLRYEHGKGLGLSLLNAEPNVEVKVDTGSTKQFTVISESESCTTWRCNSLTTWAIVGEEVLWATDVPMEGFPDTLKIVGDLLFVATTAGHSFYIEKHEGEIAFYDKSVMAGEDPTNEILRIGYETMKTANETKTYLARFMNAAVVLKDRRFIPFLIDSIENGFRMPDRIRAVAALEEFAGNPAFWAALQSADTRKLRALMPRVHPVENRRAEIAKWQRVFADELEK
ncbi:hypothetical protein OAS39_04525 [Pirellulales bacterium]|nr:hypothetical protein [Pirellulales bacterium]